MVDFLLEKTKHKSLKYIGKLGLIHAINQPKYLLLIKPNRVKIDVYFTRNCIKCNLFFQKNKY